MRKTFLFLCAIFCLFTAFSGQPPVLATYSGEQLKFIENNGQWHSDILFVAEIPVGSIYLLRDGLYYDFYEADKLAKLQQNRHDVVVDEIMDSTISHHGVKVSFLGANTSSTAHGISPYPEKINYLIGNDPEKWGKNVSAYNGVVYKNIYPYIDMKIEMSGLSFKYEFIVSPGGNPDQIKMFFQGQEELKVKDEHLMVKTSIMTFSEAPPKSYQTFEGQNKPIKNEYVIEDNVVTFKLKKVKKGHTLVIDPQLIFSTYSGSTADNWGNTACVDEGGNLYTGGTVFGTDLVYFGNARPTGFPATVGAFDTVFNGGDTDIGIIKFDSSGTFALYATYIGGNGSEIPTSMVTDSVGNLYILGVTSSTNFPMGAKFFDNTFNGGGTLCGTFDGFSAFCNGEFDLVGGYSFYGGTDIILIKLDSLGANILASTYIGGSGNDGIIINNNPLTNNYGDHYRGDINVDSEGNIYATSSTSSTNFPAVNGNQLTYGGGGSDAVIMKFNSDLDNLLWSSYLGGDSNDAGFGIILDSLNNVYVGGGTGSSNFPTTTGAFNETALGDVDGYISHFDKDGILMQSTLLGTSEFDQVYFVQLDEGENVLALGQTKGSYPVTAGKYANPGSRVFIHKLDHDLSTSDFSTVIGSGRSTPDISPTAFLVNECDNIFISGWGGGTNGWHLFRGPGGVIDSIQFNGGSTFNMPLTANSFQKNTDGSDFYLMVLENEAQSLIYSTYYGSQTNEEHVDGGTSRFDERGIVYQSVCAGCGADNNFPLAPLTGGSYPRTNNSRNCNNGVFKFDLASLNAEITAPTGCVPLEVTFQNETIGGIDYLWDFGDGKDTLVDNTDPITHVYEKTGRYKVKMIATDKTTCIGKDSVEVTIFVNAEKQGALFRDTTCRNAPITLMADTNDVNAENTYQWFPTTFLDNPNAKNPIATPTTSVQYVVTITDSLGCVQMDTFNLSVQNLSIAVAPEITGSCTGYPTVQFYNASNFIPPASFAWDFGDGAISSDKEPTHQFLTYDSVYVKVDVTDKYCSTSKTIGLNLVDGEVPNIITPNGDGINECFVVPRAQGSGNWKLTVHNRWGDLIFSSDKYLGQWCGDNLSEGTYYYLLTSPDKEECKGWVEIVR